ncbi:MAG: CopD family protein, partial [Microthrixaceae bacterium]|nr:CopD family protein [Microthrixaceae bacterium]
MVTVAALAGTGIGLFALRMPMDQLLGSAYGIIGSIKIILLSMAVVLAWQNRNTMALRKDTPTGAEVEQDEVDLETSHRNALDLRRFKATLRVEVVLVSVALLLGTVLAQVSPPGLDPATGGYFGQKLPFGTGKVELTVEPGKRGVNEIHVTALGSDGRLMADIDDLKLELHLPEKDLGPLVPSLQVITRGHSYTFARIPFGGDWKFTVTATVNRFDELSATFDVPIAN